MPHPQGKWTESAVRVARKRLDIGPRDLLHGLRCCLRPPDRSAVEARLAAAWSPPEAVVPCLSARSGLVEVWQRR